MLVCHHYDVGENYVGSVYIGGYCGLAKAELELCPVIFLVVCECPSVLLLIVVMSYVNCGDDG